jgi:ligand-binding sensor domain-containing protein
MRPFPTLTFTMGMLLWAGGLSAQPAIGQWRDHFQYRKTIAVVQGNADIYCATTTAIFKYNEQSGETERYTKVNALSDVNIQALGWNNSRNALVVGYKNGNVDVIRTGSTINLPDIKRSPIVGDKGIYCITTRNDLAYLGCGFGIVVVDLVRMEVKDTWRIGPDAAQLQVNAIVFHDDSIYAATQTGLYSAWEGETNLAAYTNWHQRLDVPGATGAFSAILSFNGHLVVNRRVSDVEQSELDTIYYFDSSWQVMTAAVGDFNRRVSVSNDGTLLTVTGRNLAREFDSSMTLVFYTENIGGEDLRPRDAIHRDQGGIWVATDGHGLVKYSGWNDFSSSSPNGPDNNSVYRMSSAKGSLYVTTGGPSGNWGDEFRKDGVHYLVDGRWETANMANDPLFASGSNDFADALNDVMPVQVDPQDGNHVFVGSWDDGLLEMRNGRGTGFYGADNSSLQRFQNSGSNSVPTLVGGLAYDEKGNLWVTNSHCNAPISVRLKNGNWYSFSANTALANNSLLSDIIVGTNGYKWIVRPRSSGLLVFSDNGTPSDPGDDQAKALNTFEGQGKLPSMDVFCVAEDQDQQIWVGTGKGVAVFYNPDAVFSTSNFDAQQILIEQDGNVQILLETESVSAIAVDGANRKWLATQTSGLFLVSADGTEQIAHYTADNSPLPSNNIICLAIDGTTGEVFIGTDLGIVSFRGDATEGSKEAECATVFPNPVRETYTGPVAITGLVRGSDVRITDVAGNLVYRTTSLGGQAIWPATDMNGERVSTGVYLVLAMDPEGASKCNTKVAVVR